MKDINHKQRIFCKSIVLPSMLCLILCSDISERSFADSNQEGLDIRETLTIKSAKNLPMIEHITDRHTGQQLVLASSLHAIGGDPLELESFLQDQRGEFSTHLLYPSISVCSDLVGAAI